MRPTRLNSLLAGACLFSQGRAVTSIPDSRMADLLGSSGVDLAIAAAPMWFFGQAEDHPPCYPTSALDSSGKQTSSGGGCEWPNAGCECRNPGVPIGNPGPSFPVYFSFQKCSEAEVRVVYNLFYEKDGFSPFNLFGHPYDWERVIVKWARSASSGSWAPAQLLLSQHSGYQTIEWSAIQNTFDLADASKPRAGDNGRKNLDHAKVYVAWAKHAHYQDRNTGWNDVLSQLTDNAFRSQDWWYFPTSADYVRADGTTEVGKKLGSLGWGSATSNPPSVHQSLCSAS